MKNKNYWNFAHPMVGTTLLIETALTYGIDLKTCLTGTHVNIEHIGRNDIFIEPEQEFRILRNVLEKVDSPHLLSLDVAKRSQIIRHGILGITTLNAKTFIEAITIMIRFSHFNSNYCYIQPTLDRSGAYLKLDNADLPKDLKEYYIERDLAALVKAQTELSPLELQPTRIQFSHNIPEQDKSAYQNFFGIEADFCAPDHRLYININALNCSLATHDETILKYGLAQLQDLKIKYKNQNNSLFNADNNSLTYQVFKYLYTQKSNGYDVESVALNFNMHSRTFHRKLKLENTSYLKIFQTFQAQKAELFLKQSDLSLEKIANELGYSEISSFSRAFKKWKGLSPRSFRQCQQYVISDDLV